ncbi:hypothetical protein [Myceligenerans crystallogenes]|uniref:Uncharacterized protein n=1 Tax=Myceligenerans crystallogenes TaxID=316335 RepID=A0ABN2N765_9MICO
MDRIEPEAVFDPNDLWGEMLGRLAWLRGHEFTDVMIVAQQHEQHIDADLRPANEPFPRLLGTERQWRQAGWRVLDGVLGYEMLAHRPRLYSLGEVAPVDLADDDMFQPVEPAELVGRAELERRVCEDLTAQLRGHGYDVAMAPADLPVTFIDHVDKTVRIPDAVPLAERAGDLAHAATRAALGQVFDQTTKDSVYNTVTAIAESAAHIVMAAAGLDPKHAASAPVRVPVEPVEGTQVSLVLMVGDGARLVANRVLAGLTTPVRHDGTTSTPAPRQGAGRPPRPTPGLPGPSSSPRPAPGPGL